MRRIARLTAIVLLGLMAIYAVASTGLVIPRTVRVVGPDDRPVEAWAAYYYQGYRFNLVDTIEYSRPGAIARTDGDGYIRFPSALYWRFPLDGRLRHRVILLSAPALHVTGRVQLDGAGSDEIIESVDGARVLRLADLTDRPEERERGLNELYSFVRYHLMSAQARHVFVTPEIRDELARQVVTEYRALVETHAQTPRGMPQRGLEHLRYHSEAERAALMARIREDLSREPLWGPYIERSWRRRIAELEARLRS